MVNLQAVTPGDLQERVPAITIEEARKIVGAVHRLDCLPQAVRMVRRMSLDAVRSAGSLFRLDVVSVHCSALDPFVRYAMKTTDGHAVETVRIPLERAGRFSVCISSQSGCGLRCSFCATGRMGLLRNLEPWEMIEQVLTVRRGLNRVQRQRVHCIVFQGMGEPLANAENVFQAIRVLCESSAQAIDGRTVTVCTAGIPHGIRRLARELPKIRLGISIGSARPEIRRMLMPIDHAHPLSATLDAAAEHACATGLASMWAITPLAGINDSEEDARALAGQACEYQRKTGMRPQIRIIPYNPIDPPGMERYRQSDAAAVSRFREILRAEGFSAHLRYSGGADIFAACGQLAARIG